MEPTVLTPIVTVPGNASRFFATPDDALAQPEGQLQFVWDSEDPLIRNAFFDSGLVRYDNNYCTTVVNLAQVTQIPTTNYFDTHIRPHLPARASVIDIGCGQGEFVQHLRAVGLDASGYDPVLRTEGTGLHPRLWSGREGPADLYVMRCVLPHIPDPWHFLDEINSSRPGALVLVEYQRIEWAIAHNVWAQLCHDHVNLFTVEDFASRYDVLAQGTFSNEEWAWVLFRVGERRSPAPRDCSDAAGLAELVEQRDRDVRTLAEVARPVLVWGAAGKGTVLCHALHSAGVPVVAIDADPNRWSRYLESSGIPVLSPQDALGAAGPESEIIVANPNHFADVAALCRDRFPVRTL